MNYKELLKLTPDDIRHMTSAEVEQVARGLTSVANSRLTRLANDKNARFSPALERRRKSAYGEKMEEYRERKREYRKALRESEQTGARKPRAPKRPTKSSVSPRFEVSSNRNKNIETIKKTKAFLNAKTNTKKGMSDIPSDLNERINQGVDDAPIELTETQTRRFWRLYNKTAESGGANATKGSEQIQKFIAQLVKGRKGYVKNQSILDMAEEFTKQLYESKESADVKETPSIDITKEAF